jgi:hypothetical protein
MRDALRELSVVHPLGKLNGRAEVIVWNESRDPGYIAGSRMFAMGWYLQASPRSC